MGSKQRKKQKRNNKILKHLKLDGIGLEIGASIDPVAPKKSGFNTKVIDYLDTESLISKYDAAGIDSSKIEEVDYVWSGEAYKQLVGDEKFDWVIASHVVEHTPDLIGFLNDCSDVLNQSGKLALVVPDMRYTFDYTRAATSMSKVIDSHLEKRTLHSAGTNFESGLYSCLTTVKGKEQETWKYDHNVNLILRSYESALERMHKSQQEGEYIDQHNWCFTPNYFRIIIEDLYQAGFTKLREDAFTPGDGIEFYITLSAEGKGPSMSRQQLFKEYHKDLAPYVPLGHSLLFHTLKLLRRLTGIKFNGL